MIHKLHALLLPYGSLVPLLLTGRGGWSSLSVKDWGPPGLQQLPWYYTDQCARQGACSYIADVD